MASGSHLLQATENTRHKWRALHLYLQSHHPSNPFLLSWAILLYGFTYIKDNAYSFAWNEDEILREIIAVRMKGIDFYRRLCSSIHPNYLPSSIFLSSLQGWNYWPFDLFFLLLWLQNYPLRANNEALTLCSTMSRTFREILVAMWETDFRNAKKTDRCLHVYLLRFVSNWLFIWEPDSLKFNYDHFRLPDGIPLRITDIVYVSVKGDQFLRAPW